MFQTRQPAAHPFRQEETGQEDHPGVRQLVCLGELDAGTVDLIPNCAGPPERNLALYSKKKVSCFAIAR